MSDWIDVKERLPDEHQQYVIAYGNGICRSFIRYAPWGYVFGNTGAAGQWGATHWMPMTLPPRKLTKDEALREAIEFIESYASLYSENSPRMFNEASKLLPTIREALG